MWVDTPEIFFINVRVCVNCSGFVSSYREELNVDVGVGKLEVWELGALEDLLTIF